MDELELFTIKVFQADKHKNDGDPASEVEQPKIFGKYQNMQSARIIKGRMLELEHSDLVGPAVKFKTVVNYERTLEPGSYLGVTFTRQDGYTTQE